MQARAHLAELVERSNGQDRKSESAAIWAETD